MTWLKSGEANKFFAECCWRKMSESATREVDIVSEITASISRMLTREVSLSKILGKNYSFQAGNIFKLAQLNRKKLERQKSVHGYLSIWLGTSLWHCDRTQTVSDCVRGSDSKTHQRLAAITQGGIPVILCQFRSSLL